MSKHTVRAVLVPLVLSLTAWLPASPANATTGTLLYSCSGSAFGTAPSYPFTAVLDSDVPAAVPYGPDRPTGWAVQLVAPDSFRQWAVDQGFTTLSAGAILTPAIDNVPLSRTTYAGTSLMSVPTTPGAWAWTTATSGSAFPTQVPASSLGHRVLTTALEVSVAFQKNGVNAYLTTATCTLDASVPAADAVVDQYDVVAATTATGLTIKGENATATVTSNGAKPSGVVTFSVNGTSVSAGVVSGQATAKLPTARPGQQVVTARFVPNDPTLQTASSATATYSAPRLSTRSTAALGYFPKQDKIGVHTRVMDSTSSPARGRVTFILKRNGVKIHNVTVRLSRQGGARAGFRNVPPHGSYQLIAKYLGNATYKPSTDRSSFTL
jgi:hypothetical protein